ncbi:MAG TPA: hypothetical protein VJW95_00380 [Dissulfurispiraceae bacterium]|nr:hypothetical protein [Dissulfurispiraceae bacterium]
MLSVPDETLFGDVKRRLFDERRAMDRCFCRNDGQMPVFEFL